MIILASKTFEIIERIDAVIPKSAKTVALITTAANTYKEAPWIELEKDALTKIGRTFLKLILRR